METDSGNPHNNLGNSCKVSWNTGNFPNKKVKIRIWKMGEIYKMSNHISKNWEMNTAIFEKQNFPP